MSSIFAWLDSSERERRRALDVIDLFDQPETVDELGLGTVRDTIADVLSPGTSTIQTRARYLFFISWIYQQLERKGVNVGAPAAARRLEVELIEALSRSDDTNGTIGIQSGAALRRLASAVYWAGLGRLGFRLYPGARDQYHRVLERGSRVVERDDAGDVALDSPFRGTWHPHMPPAPRDFPSSASFALNTEEAGFLREQLRVHATGSLLTFLVDLGGPVTGVAFPWLHPAVAEMPPSLRQWLTDGRHYSELMLGAQLLYNLLLAEEKGVKDWIDDYEQRMDTWADTVTDGRAAHQAWDRDAFWRRLKGVNPRLPLGVSLFSQRWMTQVLVASDVRAIRTAAFTRKMVSERELELKGARARLRSRAHLDLWRGASSPEPLNYRWGITQRIVDDTVSGLQRTKGH